MGNTDTGEVTPRRPQTIPHTGIPERRENNGVDIQGSVSAIQRESLHTEQEGQPTGHAPSIGATLNGNLAIAFHEDVNHAGSGSDDDQKNGSTPFHPHHAAAISQG